MLSKGPLWPLFINSIVCIKILNIYSMRKEDRIMVNLTITGLKNALNYIQEYSKEIKFHGKYKTDGQLDPKIGLIVTPEHFSEDDAYHLRVVQNLMPKLFTRLAEDYTVLSLDGQELLHVLNDEMYLSNLAAQIKTRGYSDAADVQIFKLLRERMGNDDNESLVSVMTTLLKDTINTRGKLVIDSKQPTPELLPEPEPEVSEAAKIIGKNKKERA